MAYDKDKSGYIGKSTRLLATASQLTSVHRPKFLLLSLSDFYEFIWAIGIISKGNIEDKLKLAFDIYDFNDDGFIEKKEAEKIVHVSINSAALVRPVH